MFAEIVGQENVIAGTDRGLGGRVNSQIAWAKLRALRDGAAIASKTFLELNSKLPVRMRENEKEETRSTSEPSFLPSRQCQKQRLAPCFKL